MKKRIVLVGILILVLLLLVLIIPRLFATPKELSGAELTALQQEMTEAFQKQFPKKGNPHFRYYTSVNGYHIVMWPTMLQAVHSEKIAGYTFTFSTSFALFAYKNGKFTDLKTAYALGMVNKKAIARAYEIYMDAKSTS